ncbi:hypothetical protein Q7P37_010045 [Cladosporium fusiforme]
MPAQLETRPHQHLALPSRLLPRRPDDNVVPDDPPPYDEHSGINEPFQSVHPPPPKIQPFNQQPTPLPTTSNQKTNPPPLPNSDSRPHHLHSPGNPPPPPRRRPPSLALRTADGLRDEPGVHASDGKHRERRDVGVAGGKRDVGSGRCAVLGSHGRVDGGGVCGAVAVELLEVEGVGGGGVIDISCYLT